MYIVLVGSGVTRGLSQGGQNFAEEGHWPTLKKSKR